MTAVVARPLEGKRLAWAGIAVGLAYAVVLGGGGLATQVALARLFNVGLLVASLVVWLLFAWRRPAWRPVTTAWPAIAAIVLAFAITSLTSRNPRISVEFLGYAIVLSAGYLLLRRLLADSFFARRIGGLCIMLGFVVCVWYLATAVQHWMTFWSVIGRFTMPPLRPEFDGLAYGAPSIVASITVLLWLAGAAALGLETRRNRLLLGVLAVLVAACVFVTAARAAWVGVGVTILVVGGLWMFQPTQRAQIRQWLGRPRVRLGVGMALLGLAVVAVAFLPAIASRFAEPGTDARFVFYAASIRMFLASPLVGIGPGDWTIERIAFTNPGETDYYIPHAHNVELQLLAEFGVIGVIAACVVVWAVGRLILRASRSGDPTTMRLAWAGLACAVYLVAYQQFDSYAGIVAVFVPFAIVIAWIDARIGPPPERNSHPGRAPAWITAAIALAVVVAGAWLIRTEVVALSADEGVLAIRRGDWTTALIETRTAAAADPDEPPYQFALGLAEARAGNIQAAREAMARAATVDDFPIAWLNLARLDADLGRTNDALSALDEAMRLGRQQPEVAAGAASIHLALGQPDRAADDLAAAFVVAPSLAGDPALKVSPFDAIRENAIVVARANATFEDAFLIDLELGRTADAIAMANTFRADDGARAETMAKAWSGDLAAFERLRAAALANPVDPVLAGMCRRVQIVAREQGRGADWSCAGTINSAVYLVVRVVGKLQGRPVLPGPDSSWHFEYVYRRVDPFSLLVLGLPQLQSTW
jgi:O-antigen ligase/tetratricopeptide (TPR) repeat protein